MEEGGWFSSLEGTQAVEHKYISIMRSTVNNAKQETYMRITMLFLDSYTGK